MNDGTLSHSSDPDRFFEVSDERLAAELKSQGGAPANHPVGELLDRHWEAVFSYARLCTDGVRPAGMLTTASFTRLFGDSLHQGGPSAAWRPQLLVTVRRIAAEWLTDPRRELLDAGLLAEAEREDRENQENRAAARLLPPEGRRLISRAFQRLPEPARCLLWHGEVEAEQLDVPAALLGIFPEDAVTELERARERLRLGCLEIHHELAPGDECRRYHRMLDVSFRRGGADLDPDLRRHMDECGHCRYAADQLSQFNGDLAVPLAEAVLGWGARAYVASRQARAEAGAEAVREPGTGDADQGMPFAGGATAAGNWPTAETARIVEFQPEADAVRPPGLPPLTAPNTGTPPTAHEAAAPQPAAPSHSAAATPGAAAPGAVAPGGGTPGGDTAGGGARPSRRRGAPRSGVGTRPSRRSTGHKAPRRAPGRRNVALAVLTVSALILVPLVLWVSDPGSDSKNGTADGSHSSAAPSRRTNPSWVGTGEQKDGTVRGRLRNAATGMCVGIDGTTPAIGVETRLIPCSSESATEYTYAADGLLRDADHPELCLDSHLGYSVQLAPCTGPSQPGTKNVRYDFTLQGMLVPRWNQDLALAPASAKGGAALVLKLRKDEPIQHWTLDTSSPSLQLEVVNWDSTTGDAKGSTTPERSTSSTSPAPTATRTPTATPSTPGQTTPTVASSDGSCSTLSASCPGDGHNGSARDGGYGTGSGSGGSGSYGGGGQGSRR
ncbi:ricin-type beta-trefoil lectin domain protein [Streptomyces sp. NPDC091209]|uniref:ricin-type beta-trefoil lectin domain protein n=1 Tax=Streptomyces sp. NPDC091209 TaxID=3365974 RepID=UPI003807920C